jgi:hypothetical protein
MNIVILVRLRVGDSVDDKDVITRRDLFDEVLTL